MTVRRYFVNKTSSFVDYDYALISANRVGRGRQPTANDIKNSTHGWHGDNVVFKLIRDRIAA